MPHIPRLEGVGFSVEGDVYSAYAVLDGEVYDVGFNVLNPAELVSGLAHLVADQLI